MPQTQLRPEVKSFAAPDESRPFDKGHTDLVMAAGRPVMHTVFEPGWRWSTHVKPLTGTDSCDVPHLGYCLAGRLRVYMDDGHQFDISAGDVFAVPPGHDAEVLGTETFETVDFGDVANYAKRH